jgi:hypothetical protein
VFVLESFLLNIHYNLIKFRKFQYLLIQVLYHFKHLFVVLLEKWLDLTQNAPSLLKRLLNLTHIFKSHRVCLPTRQRLIHPGAFLKLPLCCIDPYFFIVLEVFIKLILFQFGVWYDAKVYLFVLQFLDKSLYVIKTSATVGNLR